MEMIALLVVLVLVGIFAVGMYNGLIRKKNRADQAESSIDVMLKKRYDLIPNLIDAVKGYMDHERGLLEDITAMRAEAMGGVSADRSAELDQAMTGALGKLMVSVENYPDLKSSEQFLHLQGTLNEVEEQLSAARRAHNAAVTEYNIALETFPSNMMANSMGLTQRPLFEVEAGESAVPDVGAMMRDR